MRAAERRLAAASARVGVATAARYPSFTLSGTLGLRAPTLGGLDASGADSRSLASALAVTLFDGGRLRREIEIQDARQQQAYAAWEASVLAALGGLAGIVLATIASVALARAMGLPFVFEPGVHLLSFAFSALIGVVFGYFPARRAARLDPIDALRHE